MNKYPKRNRGYDVLKLMETRQTYLNRRELHSCELLCSR